MCRAAAEEASSAGITAALAARGAAAFESNLAALEACIELGARVTSRHALRGDLTYFLTPSEPPAFLANAMVAGATNTDAIPPWPLAPAAGAVLCGVALQALAAAGAAAGAPYRDAVKVWLGYEGDAIIADYAGRLTHMFGTADDELKAKVLARRSRVGGGGGEGEAEDDEEAEDEAVAAAARSSPMVA